MLLIFECFRPREVYPRSLFDCVLRVGIWTETYKNGWGTSGRTRTHQFAARNPATIQNKCPWNWTFCTERILWMVSNLARLWTRVCFRTHLTFSVSKPEPEVDLPWCEVTSRFQLPVPHRPTTSQKKKTYTKINFVSIVGPYWLEWREECYHGISVVPGTSSTPINPRRPLSSPKAIEIFKIHLFPSATP